MCTNSPNGYQHNGVLTKLMAKYEQTKHLDPKSDEAYNAIQKILINQSGDISWGETSLDQIGRENLNDSENFEAMRVWTRNKCKGTKYDPDYFKKRLEAQNSADSPPIKYNMEFTMIKDTERTNVGRKVLNKSQMNASVPNTANGEIPSDALRNVAPNINRVQTSASTSLARAENLLTPSALLRQKQMQIYDQQVNIAKQANDQQAMASMSEQQPSIGRTKIDNFNPTVASTPVRAIRHKQIFNTIIPRDVLNIKPPEKRPTNFNHDLSMFELSPVLVAVNSEPASSEPVMINDLNRIPLRNSQPVVSNELNQTSAQLRPLTDNGISAVVSTQVSQVGAAAVKSPSPMIISSRPPLWARQNRLTPVSTEPAQQIPVPISCMNVPTTVTACHQISETPKSAGITSITTTSRIIAQVNPPDTPTASVVSSTAALPLPLPNVTFNLTVNNTPAISKPSNVESSKENSKLAQRITNTEAITTNNGPTNDSNSNSGPILTDDEDESFLQPSTPAPNDKRTPTILPNRSKKTRKLNPTKDNSNAAAISVQEIENKLVGTPSTARSFETRAHTINNGKRLTNAHKSYRSKVKNFYHTHSVVSEPNSTGHGSLVIMSQTNNKTYDKQSSSTLKNHATYDVILKQRETGITDITEPTNLPSDVILESINHLRNSTVENDSSLIAADAEVVRVTGPSTSANTSKNSSDKENSVKFETPTNMANAKSTTLAKPPVDSISRASFVDRTNKMKIAKIVLSPLPDDWNKPRITSNDRNSVMPLSETVSQIFPPLDFRDDPIIEEQPEILQKTYNQILTSLRQNSRKSKLTLSSRPRKRSKGKSLEMDESSDYEPISLSQGRRTLYTKGSSDQEDNANENKNEYEDDVNQSVFKIPKPVKKLIKDRQESLNNISFQKSCIAASSTMSTQSNASALQSVNTINKSRKNKNLNLSTDPEVDAINLDNDATPSGERISTHNTNKGKSHKKPPTPPPSKRAKNVKNKKVDVNEAENDDVTNAGNDKTSNLRRSSRIKKNDASISSFAGMCANWMQNVELMHTKRQLNRTMLPKRKTAVKVTEVEEVSEKRSRINAVANKTNNRNIKNIGNDDNNPNNHNNNIESNSDKNKKKTIPIENEFVRDLSDMIWLDLLCDPNFDVTVAEKSSDFDVYFIDINDKKIVSTSFKAINFVSHNGIEYGYFPGNCRQHGIMRFHKNSVKKISVSCTFTSLCILKGNFKIFSSKKDELITGGGILNIDAGTEYGLRYIDSQIGIIQFFVSPAKN